MADSQSVCLGSLPSLSTSDRILLQEFGSGICCPVLVGTLYDERPGLSFVSHSLFICLCVYLYLRFCLLHIYHIYNIKYI
jgi:hypothetical protein